jgi:hypothetical protein
MPFIGKKEAFELLNGMEKETCVGSCRKVWLHHIQYALKSKTNPLKLTATEKKRMTRRVKEVKNAKKKTRKN